MKLTGAMQVRGQIRPRKSNGALARLLGPQPRRRDTTARDGGSTLAWNIMTLPPLLLFIIMLIASQSLFIAGSFHRDLGLGRTAAAWDLANYVRVLTDSLYLQCLLTTIRVSAVATLGTLLLSFPVAYVIARMRSRWAMLLLAGIVASTFITIVVKAFGLMIIFAGNGILNRVVMGLGLASEPVKLLGTETGVVVGLMQFTLGFAVLLLYSVLQTIPRSFEEAAQAHGASRLRVFWRILLPLSLPGLSVGSLMIFNMCMGAFTSAALLGAGHVLTLPVLIQQTIMMQVKYSMAGTLAVVLLVVVLLINLVSLFLMRRLRAARTLIA
jgi:putative spermidine/putrescine transport system permease protein